MSSRSNAVTKVVQTAWLISAVICLSFRREAMNSDLNGFGNFVERIGQRFNVFALQCSHESSTNRLADFGGNLLVLPAGGDEFRSQRFWEFCRAHWTTLQCLRAPMQSRK